MPEETQEEIFIGGTADQPAESQNRINKRNMALCTTGYAFKMEGKMVFHCTINTEGNSLK
jgi:hypothetical protein